MPVIHPLGDSTHSKRCVCLLRLLDACYATPFTSIYQRTPDNHLTHHEFGRMGTFAFFQNSIITSRAKTNTITTDSTSQRNKQYNTFSYPVCNSDCNLDGSCNPTAIQCFVNGTINPFYSFKNIGTTLQRRTDSPVRAHEP